MGDEPRMDEDDSSQESGFNKWVDGVEASVSNWWNGPHFWSSGAAKSEVKVVTPAAKAPETHIVAAAKGPENHIAAPTPAPAPAPAAEVMPKPDQSGTLTVDFKSKFFNDAIHQGGVKKLVINHQGKADVHVEVEPDGKGGQAFWGVVDEPNVKGTDKKKFILPADVDYITVNQQKVDDKNQPVVDAQKNPVYDPPTNRVAGQLRLQAFRAYFEAPSGGNYGGSSSVPMLRGVTSGTAPDNAGQTGVDDFIKNSGNISADFLSQVDTQLQHDKAVKEDASEPWFNIMLGQVHTLQAGQELQQAHAAAAIDKASLEAKVDQSLLLADQDFKAAMTIADTHLADGDKQPHLSSGQVPRYFSDIPKDQSGQVDWSNPDSDRFYYGSAKDLAAWQDRRLVKDRAYLTSNIHFITTDKETMDQAIPPLAKPQH
jgi:hypothetical protein